MKAQRQLVRHSPARGLWGDCQRTCVAAILNMDAADVPHFLDGPPPADAGKWRQDQRDWLAQFGLTTATFAWIGESLALKDLLSMMATNSPGAPMILCGRSPTGCNHAVVILDGQIVCDPAGHSGDPIIGPQDDGLWEVEVISVALHWESGISAQPALSVAGL